MIDKPIVKYNDIQRRIYAVRGVQIMLDSDLARFYGVETKVLNQAVKRNIERFPQEFCFQLTAEENELLIISTIIYMIIFIGSKMHFYYFSLLCMVQTAFSVPTPLRSS